MIPNSGRSYPKISASTRGIRVEIQAIRRQVLSEAAPKVRKIRTQYSPIAHHAIAVATDIPVADVIAPEDQDIRLLGS